MIPRPDLVSKDSPNGIEVFQLTTEPDVPSCHIYMEAQVFTPDSRRLVLHRSATPHNSDRNDPKHQYLLCDLDNGGELTPLTDELGTTGPSISPDGKWMYYLEDRTVPGGGTLSLKRVRLDGTSRETLLVLDGPIPGTSYRASRLYPLSTISSDGQRLAISCFLGDGKTEGAPWGLLVFDLARPNVRLILEGPSWCNVHPQYCRSLDPEASHDILVQENHGNVCDASGRNTRSVSGRGADIHLIRDDGTNFRNMPWGRDGNEFCQGHQCWIGRTTTAITSTGTMDVDERQLIAGRAAHHVDHLGRLTPNAWRNDLSRSFPRPDFAHFATDIAGRRFITDSWSRYEGNLYLADLPSNDSDPLQNWTFLVNPRSNFLKVAHTHPFLSPDGLTGFFNSDESGILQAYMVRGWE